MANQPTDASLLRQSIDTPERFGFIFDRHVKAVHGYLSRRAGDNAAEGLVGEVFRVAFEGRARYRFDRHEALPWLYGIAANVLLQHRRTEFRQARVTAKLSTLRPLEIDDGVGKDLELRGEVSAVMEAVLSLPDVDREAVLLYAWEELTYEQIADALDVPVGTVRSRLNRARIRIRELLGPDGQVVGEPTRADQRCRP